jgi:hypothetical protein
MLEKDLAAKEAQLQKLLEGDSGEADRIRAARAAEQVCFDLMSVSVLFSKLIDPLSTQARQLAEAEARIEAQRQKDAAEKEQQRKRQEQLEKERMRRMVEVCLNDSLFCCCFFRGVAHLFLFQERESLLMRAPPQSAETARASRPAPVAEQHSAQPAKMVRRIVFFDCLVVSVAHFMSWLFVRSSRPSRRLNRARRICLNRSDIRSIPTR